MNLRTYTHARIGSRTSNATRRRRERGTQPSLCIGYGLPILVFLFRFLVRRQLHRNAFPIPNSSPPGIPSAIIQFFLQTTKAPLRDEGAGGGALVTPVGREVTSLAVVPRETVDPGLDENEAELGVLVLTVALEVLADGNGLRGNGEWPRST